MVVGQRSGAFFAKLHALHGENSSGMINWKCGKAHMGWNFFSSKKYLHYINRWIPKKMRMKMKGKNLREMCGCCEHELP